MKKLTIDRHIIEISNEDKVFFPEDKISKGDLVEYYLKIAQTILPYMKDRPITMHRFPEGIKGDSFYQHKASDYFPGWLKLSRIEKKEGGVVPRVICNNRATLVYLANQACITPHTWLSRRDKPDYPDRMIFDLDPPERDFTQISWVAEILHEFLVKELNLTVFVMTTGSKGVHLIVPLSRDKRFDKVRSFAQSVAEFVAEQYPERITAKIKKGETPRTRLLIDTSRNAYGQTTVTPYAVRAKPGAPVATPLHWDELSDDQLNARSYNMTNIFRRLAQIEDPWQDMSEIKQTLKHAERKLQDIITT